MQEHELDDYLGGVAVTDDQRAALHRASDMIATRYPGVDDPAEDAFKAATEITLGDSTLSDMVHAWQQTRAAERDAMARLTGAIITASQTVSEKGMSELTGINRMTIRKALGKL